MHDHCPCFPFGQEGKTENLVGEAIFFVIDGSLPVELGELTLGHEASGMVEQVGSHVVGWTGGERVVISATRLRRRLLSSSRLL